MENVSNYFAKYTPYLAELPQLLSGLFIDDTYDTDAIVAPEILRLDEPQRDTSPLGFNLSDLTYSSTPITTTTLTAGTKVNIGDNEREAANYFSLSFKSKGVIAGILGTIKGESNWNHRAVNLSEKNKGYKGYGRGIALWSNERVNNFTLKMGKTIEDANLSELLQFLSYEMSLRPALSRELQRIDSSNMSEELKARATVDVMIRGFLNGGANNLASVDLMNQTYSRAWAKLPRYGKYDYETSSLSKRDKYAQNYLKSI